MIPFVIREAAKQEAEDQITHLGPEDTERAAYLGGHEDGVAWTLQHLSEQGAGEFDELACEDAAIAAGCAKIYAGKPGIHHVDCEYFDEGARWQHAQSQAVIQALRALIEDIQTERIGHYQLIDGQVNASTALRAECLKKDAENASLKAERKQAHDVLRTLNKQSRETLDENERLRAEVDSFEECCDVMWPEWRDAPLGATIQKLRGGK